ncbi:MAG: hypothetical protein AABM42_07320 [Actinomycetota bacterium]
MAEGTLDQVGLAGARLVVGVDQGRLEVPVAHPLLKRPKRHARGRHPGAEGVAKVVEAHVPHARPLGSRLETLQKPGAVKRGAGLRLAEHEIVIRLECACREVAVELAGDPVGERDRSRRATRLGRAELAAHVALANSDPGRRPVDVAPAKPQQLALPQARHGGREEETTLRWPSCVVPHNRQQGFELGLIQEANVRIRRLPLRLVD